VCDRPHQKEVEAAKGQDGELEDDDDDGIGVPAEELEQEELPDLDLLAGGSRYNQRGIEHIKAVVIHMYK
jgi:hypothetical protein